MTKNELIVNSLADHIQSNAECVERLMLIIGDSFPHTQPAILELSTEWLRINSEINKELEDALSEIKET